MLKKDQMPQRLDIVLIVDIKNSFNRTLNTLCFDETNLDFIFHKPSLISTITPAIRILTISSDMITHHNIL